MRPRPSQGLASSGRGPAGGRPENVTGAKASPGLENLERAKAPQGAGPENLAGAKALPGAGKPGPQAQANFGKMCVW